MMETRPRRREDAHHVATRRIYLDFEKFRKSTRPKIVDLNIYIVYS